MAYCSGMTTDSAASSNKCGLTATTSTICSARACTDYGIGATNDTTCNAYKSGCKFVKDGYCFLQNSDCTAYVIPTVYGNNYLLKT